MHGLSVRRAVSSLSPPLSSSVTLRKSLSLSGFHFLTLKMQLIMPLGLSIQLITFLKELYKLRKNIQMLVY